jgi:hypothetical protein
VRSHALVQATKEALKEALTRLACALTCCSSGGKAAGGAPAAQQRHGARSVQQGLRCPGRLRRGRY